MTKQTSLWTCVLLFAAFISSPAFATDYDDIPTEETGMFTADFNGPFAAAFSGTIEYARVGKTVILYFPGFLYGAASSPVTSATTSFPSSAYPNPVPRSIRPSTNTTVVGPCTLISSASNTEIGSVIISPDGNLTVNATADGSGTFSGPIGLNGWNAFSIVYSK